MNTRKYDNLLNSECVLEFFENKLKNVLWQKNQTFKIGGKIPPIWNTQYNIPL